MTQMIKAALHILREELEVGNLGFQHHSPRRLLEPQCGGRSLPYVLYRVLVSIYFFIVIVYDGVCYDFGAKWFIFLTDWFYIILCVLTLCLAFAVTFHYERAKRAPPGDAIYRTLAWPMKVMWFVQNLVLSGAILITMVYWGWTLYEEVDTKIDLPNVTAHGLITLYVLVDSFVTGIPVRLLHFWQPPILGVGYAIFTWIYWACGGTSHEGNPYIYSVMDYAVRPKEGVGLTFVLVLVSMSLHVFMWVLYRLRLWLYSTQCCLRCCCVQPQTSGGDEGGAGPITKDEMQQLNKENGNTTTQQQHNGDLPHQLQFSGETKKCLLDMTDTQV